MYIYANGDKEEGEYKDAKQIGIHVYTCKDGTIKRKKYPEGTFI